jgi:hypothetical protein
MALQKSTFCPCGCHIIVLLQGKLMVCHTHIPKIAPFEAGDGSIPRVPATGYLKNRTEILSCSILKLRLSLSISQDGKF